MVAASGCYREDEFVIIIQLNSLVVKNFSLRLLVAKPLYTYRNYHKNFNLQLQIVIHRSKKKKRGKVNLLFTLLHL